MPVRRSYQAMALRLTQGPPGTTYLNPAILARVHLSGNAVLMDLAKHQASDPAIEKEKDGWFPLPAMNVMTTFHLNLEEFHKALHHLEKDQLIQTKTGNDHRTLVWINYDRIDRLVQKFIKRHRKRMDRGWVSLNMVLYGGGSEMEALGMDGSPENVMNHITNLAERKLISLEQTPDGEVWIKTTLPVRES